MLALLALGCRPPSPSSASTSTPPTATPASRSAAEASRRQSPGLVEVNREDLDRFVEQIVTAAEARDFVALEMLMDEDFGTDLIDPGTAKEAIAEWAARPESLDTLVALLTGRCGFLESREHLLCPLALADPKLAASADATQVHLVLASDGWHWSTFVVGPPATVEATELPPSRSPLVTRKWTPVEPGSAVRGALDKDVVRKVVRAHIDDVRGCYELALESDPSLRGRVAVQFTIGPSGAVEGAAAAQSDVPKPLSDCIVDAAKTWTFPQPRGGATVVVTYPFVLAPE